jgi:hypothetical protein
MISTRCVNCRSKVLRSGIATPSQMKFCQKCATQVLAHYTQVEGRIKKGGVGAENIAVRIVKR